MKRRYFLLSTLLLPELALADLQVGDVDGTTHIYNPRFGSGGGTWHYYKRTGLFGFREVEGNREDYIYHLWKHSIHKNKFAKEYLEKLSFQELVNLHSQDHNGKFS